jgi:AcrR family transcriptional regulator
VSSRRRPELRADARRNRERVLAIAEDVFANEGLAVPVDDIARRAGVGIGTVYRHFPTKEALFAAIVQAKLARMLDHARTLARERSPGRAFFELFDRMAAEGAHKKDLVAALAGAGIGPRSAAGETADQLRAELGRMLRSAQAAGAVRKDVRVQDVYALLGAALAAASRTDASHTRLIAIVRDGLRARRASRA